MRKILNQIWKFTSYLFNKKTELNDIGFKDFSLGKLVVYIHSKRTFSEQIWVPLFNLKPLHAIDRENAIKATNDRVSILKNEKVALINKQRISKKTLNDYLPSVSGIKVVQESESSYISFEGNGRVVALQQAFKESDSLFLEVECYSFKNQQKILKRVNRVHRLNGLSRNYCAPK